MEPNVSFPEVNHPRTPESQLAAPEVESRPVTPEVQTGSKVESTGESVSSATAAAVDAAAAPSVPVPAPITTPVADDTTAITDVPTVANDDDLIEKEWVDKAKQIISDTKDNPYQRERAVSQLQREYLLKRYGKELGAAD